MLKRDITYETFDDPPQTVTETFYFNLSRTEALDIYLGRNNIEEVIQTLIKTEDRKGMVDEFKTIILASYGERSEDGKFFMKSDESRDNFLHSAAYDKLFYELLTDPKALETFLIGIMPKEVATEMSKEFGKPENVFDVPLPPLPPTA